ncbi:hypothetical protein KCP70_20825 [Salmonella enterica subsp. enterica]|nr:hypothetical protein KCP70_20825 [Salmonella enterica subsp. enterica]
MPDDCLILTWRAVISFQQTGVRRHRRAAASGDTGQCNDAYFTRYHGGDAGGRTRRQRLPLSLVNSLV